VLCEAGAGPPLISGVRAMYEWRGDKPRPDFNQALADTYVGRYILVGITYLDQSGKELRRQQLHGVIESATPEGINISLRGTRSGQSWNMPPVLDSISLAKPGKYSLHETGEVIEDPDLLSTWQIREPSKQ